MRQGRGAVDHQVRRGLGAVGGEVRPLAGVPAAQLGQDRRPVPGQRAGQPQPARRGDEDRQGQLGPDRRPRRRSPPPRSAPARPAPAPPAAGSGGAPSCTAGRRPARPARSGASTRSSSRGQKVSWSSQPSSRSSVCTTRWPPAAGQPGEGVREARREDALARAARPVDGHQPGTPQPRRPGEHPPRQLGVRLDHRHRHPTDANGFPRPPGSCDGGRDRFVERRSRARWASSGGAP